MKSISSSTVANLTASEGYQVGTWYKCGEIKSSNIENANLRIALTYNASVFKVRDYYAEISGYGSPVEANTNFPSEVITFGYKKYDGKIDLFCKKTNVLAVSAILLGVFLNYMNPNLILYPFPEVTSVDNITQFTSA
jgi:hypothetical protein